MPYMVRYAGSRSGRFKPTTRERIVVELKANPPRSVGVEDAIQRLEKGERVRTRAATYYYTEEQPLTEEQLTEQLRDAANKAAKLMGVAGRDARGRFRRRAEDRP